MIGSRDHAPQATNQMDIVTNMFDPNPLRASCRAMVAADAFLAAQLT